MQSINITILASQLLRLVAFLLLLLQVAVVAMAVIGTVVFTVTGGAVEAMVTAMVVATGDMITGEKHTTKADVAAWRRPLCMLEHFISCVRFKAQPGETAYLSAQ
jgi:hypothetical protein